MSEATGLMGAWMDAALSSVAQELAARIRLVLPPGWRAVPVAEGSALLAAAAATELRELLDRGCDTRHSAPALLTIDALVTYSCELLAVTGRDICVGSMDVLQSVIAAVPPIAPVAPAASTP
ncbi:MAG: hypothetical protein ABI194_01440 [Gemmatimonadaceae bacterium]